MLFGPRARLQRMFPARCYNRKLITMLLKERFILTIDL